MSSGNKILLLGGAAVIGGAFLYGRAYYKAAQALQPELSGFKITGYDTNTATVKGFITVAVTNKSNFIFPVPRAAVDFYSQGTYIGRGILSIPQTIGSRGVYYIDINVNLTLEQSATLLVSIITTGKLPDTINYNGAIQFGKYSIPFASSYTISGKKNLHSRSDMSNKDFDKIKPVESGFFGGIYDQFRGKPVIASRFLLYKMDGEALGVFYRAENGIGEISLTYGDLRKGLLHIENEHTGPGLDFSSIEQAMLEIDEVIKRGEISPDVKHTDRLNIVYNDVKVVISTVIKFKKGDIVERSWVFTAFDTSKSISQKRRKKPR